MKNRYVFLLGSGISRPSGLPSVVELTNSIFDESWTNKKINNTVFPFSGLKIRDYFTGHSDEFTKKIRQFLKRLELFAKDWYELTYGRLPTYEDLYELCTVFKDQLSGKGSAFERQSVLNFAGQTHDLLTPSIYGGRYHPEVWADSITEYISNVVALRLHTTNNPKGLDCLMSLAKKQKSMAIFTLNHDLLLERIFDQYDIPYLDGFGQRENDIRYWIPTLFENSETPEENIKLIKLHGSIDWFDFYSDKYGSRMGRFYGRDLISVRDEENNQQVVVRKFPKILTGSIHKTYNYSVGAFSILFFQFHKAINYSNFERLIVSGYGWGDVVINDNIITWLDQNKNNKVLLLYSDEHWAEAESRMHKVMLTFIKEKYKSKVIITHKDLSDTTDDELIEYLNIP